MTYLPLPLDKAADLARDLLDKAITDANTEARDSAEALNSWKLNRAGTARAWQHISLALLWKSVTDHLELHGESQDDDLALVKAVLRERSRAVTGQVEHKHTTSVSPMTLLTEECEVWARVEFLRTTDLIEPDTDKRWFTQSTRAVVTASASTHDGPHTLARTENPREDRR